MGPPADRQTFDRLVVEHLPSVQRFAVRLTGDPDAAEEVAQEALVRASRGWRTFRGQSQFRTWLFRVVINAFRDHRSARSADLESGHGPPSDSLTDPRSPDPSARWEAAEQGAIIAATVSGLPPRQREVLVLHVYEGLSIAEVATALETNTTNVRANLHYARQRLRVQLAGLMPDSERPSDTNPKCPQPARGSHER